LSVRFILENRFSVLSVARYKENRAFQVDPGQSRHLAGSHVFCSGSQAPGPFFLFVPGTSSRTQKKPDTNRAWMLFAATCRSISQLQRTWMHGFAPPDLSGFALIELFNLIKELLTLFKRYRGLSPLSMRKHKYTS
jgi:hypothetical protein